VRRGFAAAVVVTVVAGAFMLEMTASLMTPGSGKDPLAAKRESQVFSGAVPFAEADDGQISTAITESFVKPMLKLGAAAKPEYSWARFDVDGDGYDELMISLRGRGQCGEGGCPLVVMRKRPDGAWEPIMAAVAYKLEAVRAKAGSPADLVLVGVDGSRSAWKWNAAARKMVDAAAK
jgi:hypothetical protein